MHPWVRVVLFATIVSGLIGPLSSSGSVSGLTTVHAAPAVAALRLKVGPTAIAVGRDVALHLTVTDDNGRPVDALVSVSGAFQPAFGLAAGGSVTLTVDATTVGSAVVRAARAGYTAATVKVPIVPGSPATVVGITAGLTVIPPNAGPRAGHVGTDLLASYRAETTNQQYAALMLRDGSLVYLSSNTNVMIQDPYHEALDAGELFIEMAQGAVSHQIQIGSAVVTTTGTVLDVAFDTIPRTARITVIEGQARVTNDQQAVLVGAGQQTTIGATTPPTSPADVNLNGVVAWIHNVPKISSRVNPPVLSVPSRRITFFPAPPAPAMPTITVTGAITTSQWSGGPYRVIRRLDVPLGATLTIAAGTIVEMAPNSSMTVEGTLWARGQQGAPITFISSIAPGRPSSWDALVFTGKGSSGSVLDAVRIYDGGHGNRGQVIVSDGAAPTLSHDSFADSGTLGLYVDDQSLPAITGCGFAGDAGGPVSLPVDDVELFTGAGLGAAESNVLVRGGSLSHDAMWSPTGVPLLVAGHVDIPIGKSLTLAAGSVLKLEPLAQITVEGTLNARGTTTSPIILTSSMVQPRAGSWNALTFSGTGASGSVLDHVAIFYGGSDSDAEVVISSGANPTLSNTVIAESSTRGLYVDDSSRPTVDGCTFSGDGPLPVSLPINALAQFTGGGFSSDVSGIVARGASLTRTTAWTRTDVPLFVQGFLDVPINQVLKLGPGSTLEMEAYASMTVEGTLIASGTSGAPVIVTSSLEEARPGSWDAISFSGTGADKSMMTDVQVLAGGYDSEAAVTVEGGATPLFRAVLFGTSMTRGLYVDDISDPTVLDCMFFSNTDGPASFAADAVAGITGAIFDTTTGIQVRGGIVNRSATWTRQDVPLVLSGHIDIPIGITLTIKPGTMLGMKQFSFITAEGILNVRGTAGDPIVFTSSLVRPPAGAWKSISLNGRGANGSVLDNVQLLYGGSNSAGALIVSGGSRPVIGNCGIAQSSTDGIWVDSSSLPTIAACHFANDRGYAISIPKAAQGQVRGNTFGPGQRGVEVQSASNRNST